MTDPSVFSTQSSVDTKLDEAKRVLPSSAIQDYVRARTEGHTHEAAMLMASAPKTSNDTASSATSIQPASTGTHLSTTTPATTQSSSNPSKTSHADPTSTSATAAPAEKRTIAQVAGTDETPRPATRSRTETDECRQADSGTAVHATPTTGIQTAPAPALPRVRTPEPEVSMDAIVKAFQRFSPSKRQSFLTAVRQMDPPSSPDRVDPLATHVVPSPVAAISSLGHASAPAHALTGTAGGGPLNGFAASSSPFQSAAPKEIVPLARVGESRW
ncbi:hypothetical protein A4X09_0g3088 [Tilletia walkeri]|uniref:Uncharacterized protein n=1 Tax=Tilletia walkeri TaxID=117179 RepID=A0A8X7NA70_9BASI|nr:hypothetical protein A4X09_0g3088 [Tilletia walkeri]